MNIITIINFRQGRIYEVCTGIPCSPANTSNTFVYIMYKKEKKKKNTWHFACVPLSPLGALRSRDPNTQQPPPRRSRFVCLTNSWGAICRSRPGCDSARFFPGKEASGQRRLYTFCGSGRLANCCRRSGLLAVKAFSSYLYLDYCCHRCTCNL
jgi:hypothetical protein